ncbi:MAG: hypothetical protein ACYC7E_07340 [Armatimonadota bacterium]
MNWEHQTNQTGPRLKLILRPKAELESLTTNQFIDTILTSVPVPR